MRPLCVGDSAAQAVGLDILEGGKPTACQVSSVSELCMASGLSSGGRRKQAELEDTSSRGTGGNFYNSLWMVLTRVPKTRACDLGSAEPSRSGKLVAAAAELATFEDRVAQRHSSLAVSLLSPTAG